MKVKRHRRHGAGLTAVAAAMKKALVDSLLNLIDKQPIYPDLDLPGYLVNHEMILQNKRLPRNRKELLFPTWKSIVFCKTLVRIGTQR